MSPVIEEEGSDIEAQPPLPKDVKVKDQSTEEKESTKPKPRARTKAKAKAVEITDDEDTITKNKTQGKRKASADSEAESEQPDKKTAKMTAKPERSRTTDLGAKKAVSGAARGVSEDRASIGSDPVQKPKKRKINVFAGAGSQSSQLAGFDFGLGVCRPPSYIWPVMLTLF